MPHSSSRIRVFRHDSPLGRWTVTTLEPHALLHGIVRSIWQGEGRVTYSRDRILPGGQSYLLVNLGPPQYLVAAGRESSGGFRSTTPGFAESATDRSTPRRRTAASSRRRAHDDRSRGVVAVATSRACESHRAARGLARCGCGALRERLLHTANAAARLLLLEDWLLARYVTGRRIHPLVHWATQRLAESGGGIRTAVLARDAGCSRKHLVELFSREVGLPPKTLARVHRFQKGAARQSLEPLSCLERDRCRLRLLRSGASDSRLSAIRRHAAGGVLEIGDAGFREHRREVTFFQYGGRWGSATRPLRSTLNATE